MAIDESLRLDLEAFVDGQLEPEAAARIEQLIETDPEAKSFVEWLRRSNELLATAFSPPQEASTDEPTVEELAKRLRDLLS